MSLTKLVLRLAAPVAKLENFERFLFLGPHPDDIEVGAGATAAKLASLGKSVYFLVCTDGRYGLENAPSGITPEALAALRRQESVAAATALGAKEVQFLNLSDGGFYEQESLLWALAQAIGRLQPDVIFAPDPTVRSECHADHRRVGEAAKELAFFAPFPAIMEKYGAKAAPVQALALYMTARPNRCVGVRGYLDRQMKALFSCHTSQFPSGSRAEKELRLYLRLRAVDFGLRSGKGLAEGFRVLGRTQMHCLPEAD